MARPLIWPGFFHLLDRSEQACRAACHTEIEWFTGNVLHRCFAGPAEIPNQHCIHFSDELTIRGKRGDFEVQSERPIVEIGGAYRRQSIIDQHDLLMQEALLVAKQFYPKWDGLFVVRKCRQPDEQLIRSLWDENPDIHPADGGDLQGGEHAFVRDEIRGGDP